MYSTASVHSRGAGAAVSCDAGDGGELKQSCINARAGAFAGADTAARTAGAGTAGGAAVAAATCASRRTSQFNAIKAKATDDSAYLGCDNDPTRMMMMPLSGRHHRSATCAAVRADWNTTLDDDAEIPFSTPQSSSSQAAAVNGSRFIAEEDDDNIAGLIARRCPACIAESSDVMARCENCLPFPPLGALDYRELAGLQNVITHGKEILQE